MTENLEEEVVPYSTIENVDYDRDVSGLDSLEPDFDAEETDEADEEVTEDDEVEPA